MRNFQQCCLAGGRFHQKLLHRYLRVQNLLSSLTLPPPLPPTPLYKITLLVRLKASQIDILAAIAEKFLRQTTANYHVGERREIIISETENKSMPGEKICCEILYLSIICCIDSMHLCVKSSLWLGLCQEEWWRLLED